MSSPRAQVAAGRAGMVVSGHRDATETAWRILASGGTVADAAIAGAAVLTVTQPQACTLGGDAFILVHDASSRRTEGLNASGFSPRLAEKRLFEKGIPERGALTANVPGVVGGWEALHQRFGTLPWNTLLEPAIALAAEGCAASRGFARATAVYAKLIDAFEPSRRLFHPEGKPLAPGDRFRQPQLARTLEKIAQSGAEAFYEGEIARSIARACEAQGGVLRAEDFAGYKPEWVAPLEVEYRGHRVRAMPPNSYGLYLLLQLRALRGAEPEIARARFSRSHSGAGRRGAGGVRGRQQGGGRSEIRYGGCRGAPRYKTATKAMLAERRISEARRSSR